MNSLYEEDKDLVTMLLTLRVLDGENYLDQSLYTFLLSESHSHQGSLVINSFMTQSMLESVQKLSQIKPFTN